MTASTSAPLPLPQRIAVVFGGMSSEHEISVASASLVIEGFAALARERSLDLQLQPIYITREGAWVWAPLAAAGRYPSRETILAAERWELRPEDFQAEILSFPRALGALREGRSGDAPVQVAFLVLHGQNGEDGRLQGALDLAGIPYTGSGAEASALAFDKPRGLAVLSAAGVPIAASTLVRAGTGEDGLGGAERVLKLVGIPCVVKPARGGSSVGVSIVTEESQLRPALHEAFAIDEEVMVERYIKGREFTCGVLDTESGLTPLPVTEIIPPEGRFFDYEVKYQPGLSREVTPAEIPPALAVKLQTLALAAHRALGCRGFSRTDFIANVEAPDQLVVLEVNTIPGMTATSLLPQAAAAHGIPFPALLARMLATAAND